jgi:hypothetical protein
LRKIRYKNNGKTNNSGSIKTINPIPIMLRKIEQTPNI